MEIEGVDYLKTYFERYSEVPREVIVKEDILGNGLRFSPAGIEACQDCRHQTYYLFTFYSSPCPLSNRSAIPFRVGSQDYKISTGDQDTSSLREQTFQVLIQFKAQCKKRFALFCKKWIQND